ncbi:hypothetical protein JTE90_027762 [Oedothorax gibbosus]|uniref:Uncharacterized protein n=1 Tax=Oedothorax gibbosus TaxID=931172 RepID=A0AAV6V5V1_9ARAC|nr:hypothetical protein JTE90_027762 [Oedothorax gibbosus]
MPRRNTKRSKKDTGRKQVQENHQLKETESETASKNREIKENKSETEESKEHTDRDHQTSIKLKKNIESNEQEEHKSIECVRETESKNKEHVEKGIENADKKSIPDQSRSAELPNDSHQTSSKEKEGHKSNKSLDSHQNNSKEKEGHKSHEVVIETAATYKDSVEEGIKNEENKSTIEQSRITEKPTDSHQNSNEKEGQKLKEGVIETVVKNKDSVEEGIENEDKKSTTDQSRIAELPTDSHQNNNKEKDRYKLNEGVIETSAKNNDSAEEGIEKEENKSTTEQSRITEKPTDSHQNSNEKEGQK